ncbi:MAG: hypothetical protein ACQEWV_28415 [Bacillota bacterium]
MILLPIAMAAGSFIAGALLRQPEINQLKNEIKRLQKEVKRLNKIIEDQNKMIEQLKFEYKKLRATHFMQKRNLMQRTKGMIVFQYAYKEYIQRSVVQAKGKKLSKKEEQVFYEIFDKLIHGMDVSLEEKGMVKLYIETSYPHEVINLIPLDSESLIEEVESVRIA